MIIAVVLVIVVSAGLLALGPSLDDRRGRRPPGTSQPTGTAAATVDVEALASIKFNATEYTAPAGIVRDQLQRRHRPHLAIQDPKYNGFQLEHRRRRPEDGQGQAGGRQVHDLLHRRRPRGAGHEGDDHRSSKPDATSAASSPGSRFVLLAAVLFAAAAAAVAATAAAQATSEPKGPPTETLTDRRRQLLLQARQRSRPTPGITTIKLDGDRRDPRPGVRRRQGPGFQLEATAAAAPRRRRST